jgi:hypothetical protein
MPRCARRATRSGPDASGTPKVLGGIGPGNLWFDTSVFSAPAQNTWGNVVRNGLLDGPAYINADISLAKVLILPRRSAASSASTPSTRSTSAFQQPERHAGQRQLRPDHAVPDFSERLLRFGLRIMF